MIKTAVQSSNIKEVGWESEALYVTFKTGRTYRYAGVSLSVYNELVAAPSAGKFLSTSIIPSYPAIEVTADTTPA